MKIQLWFCFHFIPYNTLRMTLLNVSGELVLKVLILLSDQQPVSGSFLFIGLGF